MCSPCLCGFSRYPRFLLRSTDKHIRLIKNSYDCVCLSLWPSDKATTCPGGKSALRLAPARLLPGALVVVPLGSVGGVVING